MPELCHVFLLSFGEVYHAPDLIASRSVQTPSSTDAIGLTSAISFVPLCTGQKERGVHTAARKLH